ncbi:MAG: hypothetical protein COT33_02535 [Candidatus Nealsonbacteria bacterium CG08_land_8_20_14_0_20_38_20]|uniref:Uncharacterized protein n=1 Tax=Candidatus Nealsonbacteria bacterium CG08_land_8_20_14_0_20_38_20 TaxID=1974705 RepID=A0A2H0YLF8_9BACT|nr:MAG: hypothetical protein COT33_02535 [Candidatus Nealsonbacteria bacterium CG08_land_8_20_14_0_20_38_20]
MTGFNIFIGFFLNTFTPTPNLVWGFTNSQGEFVSRLGVGASPVENEILLPGKKSKFKNQYFLKL